MTEEELLKAIMDTLLLRYATSRDAVAQHIRRSDRAIVQGLPGLPDIVGVVGTTLIAWELKTDAGALRREQLEWRQALDRVDGIDVRVIRPADLDGIIEEVLDRVLLSRRRAFR
jgi:hypothetical protein